MKYSLCTLLLLISLVSSAQIDTTLGISAPKKVAKNYKVLTHYLCDSLETDYEKANAIYNWVTNNIEYDVKSIHRSKLRTDKPNAVLKRGKTICGGYADLITAMCKETGMRAQTIIGYYKDWKFDEGDKFFIPNHAWNAVQIENKWYYIDATAGAGFTSLEPNWFQKLKAKINKKKLYSAKKPKFIQKYDPQPFLPNIAEFREERLSADPIWQLSDSVMPLSIFEEGEEKIEAFNASYGAPKQFSVELSKVNDMDWDDQVLESAERTFAFNPRYTTMLARKKYVESIYGIGRALDINNKSKGRLVLNDAKKELDQTKDIQVEQKKMILSEINLLKQKNKAKTASFKKYKQELDKDNKAKSSALKTRKRQAVAAISLLDKKQAKLKKAKVPNSAQTIQGIETMKNTVSADRPSLRKIEDSIRSRNMQLADVKTSFAQTTEKIKNIKQKNNDFIKQAATYYDAADSFLYLETSARYEMHDDYDKEVKRPQGLLQEARLVKLNQVMDEFMDSYDSLTATYKTQLKLLEKQHLLYKTNLKNIEQYKRQNDQNKDVLKFYNAQIQEDQELRKTHLSSINNYRQSMKAHTKLFNALLEAHKRELKYTELMELAENKRNELEAKKIKKDAEWLKAGNKKTKQLLTQTKKEADKLFKLRHNSNSKKWEKEMEKLEAKAKSDD